MNVSLGIAANPISSVTPAAGFFNPSIGQSVSIEIELTEAGKLSASVVDRDGYVVRTLAADKPMTVGKTMLRWDGEDQIGEIVPDEAYSLKIDVTTRSGNYSYFPANQPSQALKVDISYYDRQNHILSYKLPQPARVHIQAGSATIDPRTKMAIGPVMKTIVNREPRASGAVIEYWLGYDESGTIFVPDLPSFVTSIAATALPENSIIAVGNHNKTFIESIENRSGKSLFTYKSEEHSHHQGLSTLGDVSPNMKLKPLNAVWIEKDKAWKPLSKSLKIDGSLYGPSASTVASQPGSLWLFVDGHIVHRVETPKSRFQLNLQAGRLSAGVHIVAVNWGSKYGPTAAASFRIAVDQTTSSRDSNAKSTQ